MKLRLAVLLVWMLIPLSAMPAADSLAFLVKSLNEAKPGQTVELPEGVYHTKGPLLLEGKRGTEKSPIIIRAAGRGEVTIRGHSGFVLKDCEHVVIEGIVFENDANQHGVLLENCRHVWVTRCIFRLDETKTPRWAQYWLYVTGARSGHNQIDRNLFEKQKNRGTMVFIRGDDATLTPSQHDRVTLNHFRDVIYANDSNGHETLRTGSNDLGAAGKSTFTLVESNLFERCSGEQEIVSLKSSGNILRHNTFIDCRGSICLRLGNRNEITGNVLLNPGRVAGTGGVKVYGFEHQITGNHFHGLTGENHEAPLALVPGTMDTESTMRIGKAYQDLTTVPATRVTISGNIWIDCAPLMFGNGKPDAERKHVPKDCVFTGNVVAGNKTPLIRLGVVDDLQVKENIGHGPSAASKEPWGTWFRWEKQLPAQASLRPLTSTEVGPNVR